MSTESEVLDVRGHMDRIMLAARFLADAPIHELLRNIERVHTIGPFMEPTMYRDALYNRNLDWQEKVLRAALPLQRVIIELRESLEGERTP